MSREFDELLSAYLDGEVTPEERAVVERRLEQSPDLRDTLEGLSEVGDLIRSLPRPRPPIDLPDRVVAAIAPKPLAGSATPARRGRLWRAWPLLTAGTVIAAGVTVAVLLPNQNSAVGRRVATGDALPAIERAAASPARAAAPASVLAASPASGAAETNVSPPEESLATYLRRLDRAPQPGDVLSTLVSNAGQTQVLRYVVVDTREAAGTVKTIFANNSFDIIVTETPTPAPVAAATQVPMYWYVEGPADQVGKSLQEIETMTTGKVDDLGLLADVDQQSFQFLPAEAPAAGDAAAATPADAEFRAPSDPTPVAATAVASPVSPMPADSPLPAEDGRSNLGLSTRAAAAPASNSFRGVSAQLDSQSTTPIVENMLRGRASNNLLRGGNALETQRGNLLRSTGNAPNTPNTLNAPEARRSFSGNALPGQASTELGLQFRQQSESESVPSDKVAPQNGLIANPAAAPANEEPLIRALIILEPEPAVAAPAGKKAAD